MPSVIFTVARSQPAAAAETRPIFRELLEIDDATWTRGRGWALSQAMIALPYYLHTYPVIVQEAWRWLAEALADS